MRIEEAKRTGKEVAFYNETKPRPINLNKREVHNLHHEMGEDGYERQRGPGMWKPYHARNDATVAGRASNALRASEMGMEDMYGRQSNIQGGLYEAGASGESYLGTMNPMASSDEGFVGSSHNPILDQAEDGVSNSQL